MWGPKNVIKLLGPGPVYRKRVQNYIKYDTMQGAHYHGLNIPGSQMRNTDHQ
jgi:hypothetical protein